MNSIASQPLIRHFFQWARVYYLSMKGPPLSFIPASRPNKRVALNLSPHVPQTFIPGSGGKMTLKRLPWPSYGHVQLYVWMSLLVQAMTLSPLLGVLFSTLYSNGVDQSSRCP